MFEDSDEYESSSEAEHEEEERAPVKSARVNNVLQPNYSEEDSEEEVEEKRAPKAVKSSAAKEVVKKESAAKKEAKPKEPKEVGGTKVRVAAKKVAVKDKAAASGSESAAAVATPSKVAAAATKDASDEENEEDGEEEEEDSKKRKLGGTDAKRSSSSAGKKQKTLDILSGTAQLKAVPKEVMLQVLFGYSVCRWMREKKMISGPQFTEVSEQFHFHENPSEMTRYMLRWAKGDDSDEFDSHYAKLMAVFKQGVDNERFKANVRERVVDEFDEDEIEDMLAAKKNKC